MAKPAKTTKTPPPLPPASVRRETASTKRPGHGKA